MRQPHLIGTLERACHQSCSGAGSGRDSRNTQRWMGPWHFLFLPSFSFKKLQDKTVAKNPALKHRCGALENYFASLCLGFPNCGVEMEWLLWGGALIRVRWVGAWHMVFVTVTWGKSLPLSLWVSARWPGSSGPNWGSARFAGTIISSVPFTVSVLLALS